MGKATTDSRFERLDFHHRLRQLDGLSTTARMTARTVWQSDNAFAARGISPADGDRLGECCGRLKANRAKIPLTLTTKIVPLLSETQVLAGAT